MCQVDWQTQTLAELHTHTQTRTNKRKEHIGVFNGAKKRLDLCVSGLSDEVYSDHGSDW